MVKALFVISTILLPLSIPLTYAQTSYRGLNLVDQRVIETRLRLNSTRNEERERLLKELFEQSGCTGKKLTEQHVEGSSIPNLICELAGSSNRTVIVIAHSDREPFGEGVIDNWTGAVLLPTLFQGLLSQQRQLTFRFIAATEGVRGGVGAEHYLNQLGDQERNEIVAVIGLDSLGLSQPMIAGRVDASLLKYFGDISKSSKISFGVMPGLFPHGTDTSPFRKGRLRTLQVQSITQDKTHGVRSVPDILAWVSIPLYYDTYRLLLAYLDYIDLKY